MSTTELTPSEVFSLGSLRFYALGDRVLIEEDKFRSGYECSTCDGKGFMDCPNCAGKGKYDVGGVERKCSECSGNRQLLCPDCGGKGGLLAVPETAQRRPTTGRVVSAGPDCKTIRVGQQVMYSNFAGYVVDLKRADHDVTIRILHETELLCGMSGQLDLKGLKGKSEVAVFNP